MVGKEARIRPPLLYCPLPRALPMVEKEAKGLSKEDRCRISGRHTCMTLSTPVIDFQNFTKFKNSEPSLE
jgi:hypothetical protein